MSSVLEITGKGEPVDFFIGSLLLKQDQKNSDMFWGGYLSVGEIKHRFKPGQIFDGRIEIEKEFNQLIKIFYPRLEDSVLFPILNHGIWDVFNEENNVMKLETLEDGKTRVSFYS